jgi:hypothetical protein
MPKDFDLDTFEVQGSTGLDAFFARNPSIVTPVGSRRKIASLHELKDFVRVSNETLIHRSERDLWSICRQENGSLFVERQFDDNGTPLKV